MRESIWGNEQCACGSRAFYATKTTVFEWIAFRLGWWKVPDFSKVTAVNAPLGGEVERFKATWDEIAQSVPQVKKEKANGE